MDLSLRLIRTAVERWRLPGTALWLAASAVTGVAMTIAVFGLISTVDTATLETVGRQAVDRPQDVVLGAAAFLAAFVIRAELWARLTPGLHRSHALAGILCATGANHLLPYRLGEPLRVVSVVRRAGLPVGDATASTVVLRAGDVLALLAIGLLLGPRLILDVLGWWGLPVTAAVIVLAAGGLTAVGRAARDGRLRLPDAVTGAGTAAAWLAEAVLLWRVAALARIELSYLDAVLVGSVAVAAQLVAIAPGGFGTYEAAAVVALVAAGVPTGPAVAVAVATHGAKSALTIGAGTVAAFVPEPGLFGRFRVPRDRPQHPSARAGDPAAGATRTADRSRPVVLFLPANDEEPRLAAVIARAPDAVAGFPVEIIVVDDGSTDGTADVARRAGARVVSHRSNRGLGAAVETGFRAGLELDPVALAFCDADGEYDPAELGRLVGPILDGSADYVVGSRFSGEIEHMQPHRRVGNRVLTRWVAWMTRLPITDGQSGYRALSPEAAAATVSAHDYNYAQVLTLDLTMRGFRYREVPIRYRFRRSGRSFVRLGVYLRRCLPAAWRVVNGPSDRYSPTGSPDRYPSR